MSDTSKELKPQNVPRLALFLVLNVVAFFILVAASGHEAVALSIRGFVTGVASIEEGAVLLVASLAVIVYDGVIPNTWKDRLVFWRRKNPLPGFRAFTEFAPKNPSRISIDALKKHADPLPTDPDEQNKLWLDLSVKYQAEPSVIQAHRSYLLTYEMTSLSVLFLVLYPLTLLLTRPVSTEAGLVYAAVLFVQYLIVATAARHYGKNFVIVVLARASSTV